ncbi:hypothetical protein BCV72DRAFT_303062 [Rhizopus microsporus var. microsporus]|uniref:Uncharacterized protein n=2 Tax=Rhizopus microsporus TaxID=58291 RepID=A0A2G4T1V6_RHIZD|nr:uncharacterized protein RHIMIDRAFT_235757 [Rhizopus microsporus ATCC 52813]ORE09149.1 hypothetical protein BCV72DRAFT_303062 [Rhizopus microsporus var. microsporus]PHZ14999.1 hypothetical protein RHIMIDRAFT_235757 [Rhizopus microsporus ATCC 52813]
MLLSPEERASRIRSYIEDQRTYAPYYEPPDEIPVSIVINDDDDDINCNSLLMTSVSQVDVNQTSTRRNISIQASIGRENDQKRKDVDHELKKPYVTSTKPNGLHLLEKFTSPNIEIDRITIKSRKRNRPPSLGLFNKGKSSAKGKLNRGVPDLVFSEAEFLKRQTKEDQNSVRSSSLTKRNPRCTEKKSRFFKKQDDERDERAIFGHKQQPCAEDDNSSCRCCEILSDYDDNENGATLSEDNCGLLYSNNYCSYSQIPSYSHVRSPSTLPITTGYHSIDWQIEDNQDDDSDALTLKRDQLDTFWIKRKL